MLKIVGKQIIMDEGDYGLPLVMKIINTSGQIESTDKIIFSIKKGNENIVEEKYESLEVDENDKLYFTFSLTKEDSKKLTKGGYIYELKVYRDEVYLNTLTKNGQFSVE